MKKMIEVGIRHYVHKYFYYGAQVSPGLLCSLLSAFPPMKFSLPFLSSPHRSSPALRLGIEHWHLLLPAPGLCLCSFEIIRLVCVSPHYRVTVARQVWSCVGLLLWRDLVLVWCPTGGNRIIPEPLNIHSTLVLGVYP